MGGISLANSHIEMLNNIQKAKAKGPIDFLNIKATELQKSNRKVETHQDKPLRLDGVVEEIYNQDSHRNFGSLEWRYRTPPICTHRSEVAAGEGDGGL